MGKPAFLTATHPGRFCPVCLAVCGVFLAARAALAANSANILDPAEGGGGVQSTVMTTLAGFAPILIFLVILFWLYHRQAKSPLVELQRRNAERYHQHMQRMEELLERIAVQLERQDKP